VAFASAKVRMTEMRGTRAGLAPKASNDTVSDYASPDPRGSPPEDSDMSLHAMSAYRRSVGDEAALPILIKLERDSKDPKVQKQAKRAARADEKKRNQSENPG
jgi:hypothetical protein